MTACDCERFELDPDATEAVGSEMCACGHHRDDHVGAFPEPCAVEPIDHQEDAA